MARKYIFNLLQPLQPPKTYWDKIYEWLVGRARVILLIVEVLIVIAFGAKVVVDNIGKNRQQAFDIVKTQVDLISSNYEQDFRRLQFKDSEYRKIWDRSSYYETVLRELSSYITFNSTIAVTMDGYDLSISGFQDLDDINELEIRMKNSPNFSQVLTTLNLSEQDILENFGQFTITAKIGVEVIRRPFLFDSMPLQL